MCGIVGIIQSDEKGPVDPGILRNMNTALTHRGPDDEGYWVNRNVGLAMRRLSIIDLEGGHQPISNETGEIWTVFNGEIYNFLELREQLLKKGHRFQTRTDTEVIVHLYEEEGETFVQKLRGMFAIALWDNRSQKFLLYRDRIGIKPVHYWFKQGTLVFGSEIKAILEYPEVSLDISLPALSDYLSFLYIPSPKTIYQDIQKLSAGHWLRYQKEQVTIHPYWDFSFQPNYSLSEKDWCEKLCDVLAESVKLHMISDVPLGAFLSGGVDSSTVVAWMSRQSGRPVKTYSIGFPDSQFNELPYASAVAKHFGTDHHEALVETDAFRLLPKILTGFDEPFADSSAIPTFLVSEFARREVTVALSGDGGDELFGGYLWTRKELWLEKYRQLPVSWRRKIEKLILEKDYRPLRETTFLSSVKRFLYDAGLAPWESFARRATSFQPWMKQKLFTSDVLSELEHENSLSLLKSYSQSGNAQSVIDQLLYFDSKVYLPDDVLAKVDRMSMLNSLEVRVPLLDHKLVELAATIPASLKLKNRTTKYILKQAMKDLLPPIVLKQRKQGFSIPIQRWFRNELLDFAKKILLDEKGLTRKFFRLSYVKWLLDQHASGRQRFGTQIYALLVFELWSRLAKETKGRIASKVFSLKELV